MHKKMIKNAPKKRSKMNQKTIKNAPKNDDYFIGNHSL